MSLSEAFRVSLTAAPSRVALDWQGESLTFADLEARSNRLARALAGRGLRPGDRLSVCLANSPAFVDLYLASIKLGLIFVPINTLYRERERRHILDDAAPSLHIEEAELATLGAEASGLPAEALTGAPVSPEAPAALVYTSGTTGRSKGAVLTHRNFEVNGRNLVEQWRIVADDRLLLALPLFHVHALGNGLHVWLLSGCRMRLLERFDQTRAAEDFLDFRPTVFFGVPTIYLRLLDLPGETAREIGRGMRLFVSGSAPLPARVMGAFEDRFGHTILERYGMTETLMNLSNPYDGERRPGSVGFPLPGVEIRLVDEAGRDVPDGAVGEIWIRGPNVCSGYWRQAETTARAFGEGWFRTGDLCVRSPDGYHTLCGRISDMIICNGYNIYPLEVEEILLERPDVAEVAVVGEPDPERGEIPVAYVVLRDEVSPRVLEAWCQEQLAGFKRPRRFEIVESLPRNALGKVQKHRLGPGG